MPKFLYTNNFGQEEEVFPEAMSRALPNAIHCLDKKGNLLTIHRDCLRIKYSEEELKAHAATALASIHSPS